MQPAKPLRQAAQKGVDGDTILAHISPSEAALLKALGGVGTRNPKTGLPQFHGGMGGNAGGGSSNGHSGDHDGGAGGGGSGNTRGGDAAGNTGKEARDAAGSNGLGGGPGTGPGSRGNPGIGGKQGPNKGAGSTVAAEHMHELGQTVGGYGPATGGFRSSADAEGGFRTSLGLGPRDPTPTVSPSSFVTRQSQLQNAGLLEKALNFFEPLGINTKAPIGNPASYAEGKPQVSVNPGSLAGGMIGNLGGTLGGMLGGMLGGTAYHAAGLNDVTVTGPGGLFGGKPSNVGQETGGMMAGTTGTGSSSTGGVGTGAGGGTGPDHGPAGGGGQHDATASLAQALAGASNAQGQQIAQNYPTAQLQTYGQQQVPINQYQGTPFTTNNQNVWAGGGSASKPWWVA